MADHGHAPSQPALTGMDAHRATYEGFLRWSIMTAIIGCYILVALVTFRFMDYPLNLLVGFGGIVIGSLSALIAMRMGGKWLLPAVLLVVYGLFVANNIHMS